MRFNSDAYDKLYPRKEDVEVIETPVETFTPTTDKLNNEVDSNETDGTIVEEDNGNNDNND